MFKKAIKIIFLGMVASTFVACSSTSKNSKKTEEKVVKKEEAKKAEASKMATTHKVTSQDKFFCKKDKDLRTIESNVLTEKKGCKLYYTKWGVKKEIASSEHGRTHCDNVSSKIKGNLETAGYTCSNEEAPAASVKKEEPTKKTEAKDQKATAANAKTDKKEEATKK